jgi:hypothetical protein
VRDTPIDYNPGAGNLHQARVIALDPRPANDALTSAAAAPNDGFFTSASYRGAFSPPVSGVDVLAVGVRLDRGRCLRLPASVQDPLGPHVGLLCTSGVEGAPRLRSADRLTA